MFPLAQGLIKYLVADGRPLPDGLHRRVYGLFREYMLVGGMPAPLSLYVEKKVKPHAKPAHGAYGIQNGL